MGLTQEQLAKQMGVAVRTIVRYENDLPPRGTALVRFAELAERTEREDLMSVFGAALLNALEKSGALRPAFASLQKQYFVKILARLKGELAKFDEEQNPEAAVAALGALEHAVDWNEIVVLYSLVADLEAIHDILSGKSILSGKRRKKDPVAAVAEIRERIKGAEGTLETRLFGANPPAWAKSILRLPDLASDFDS